MTIPEYIYIYHNIAYEGLVKLGETKDPINRKSTYKTGLPKDGIFLLILCVENSLLVEKHLQNEFKRYHYEGTGGTEFYNSCITDKIKYTLDQLNVKYTVIDYNDLIRKQYCQIYKTLIAPYKYQEDAINLAIKYYKKNDLGIINWACGLGKTLLALFIAKQLGARKILIGVFSIDNIQQFKDEIDKVFPNASVGNTTDNDIIITTYHSCHKINTQFDFIIADEAHHLTGDGKLFIQFHQIKGKKLFMTATLKNTNAIYSMDNSDYFGHIIDKKTVKWAINNKFITDYKILIIKNTEDQIDEIINKIGIKNSNRQIFMAIYITLQAIEKKYITHNLLYTNTTDDADLAKQYFDLLIQSNLFTIAPYCESLHSNSCNKTQRSNALNEFVNSQYGIIPNVYIFGEGTNIKKLDSVTFSTGIQSNIRIVQCAMRPNRLNGLDKTAHIIIPYIDSDDFIKSEDSFSNVKKILYELGNVDENIEYKIKVINSKKNIADKIVQNNKSNNYEFIESQEDLNKIKLRLRNSKTLRSIDPLLDEYNDYREINKSRNIQCKSEYFTYRDVQPNPETHFATIWKNWYHFLNIDCSKFPASKDEWKKLCCGIKNIADYPNYAIKNNLPIDPAEYYNGFTNLNTELSLHRRRY